MNHVEQKLIITRLLKFRPIGGVRFRGPGPEISANRPRFPFSYRRRAADAFVNSQKDISQKDIIRSVDGILNGLRDSKKSHFAFYLPASQRVCILAQLFLTYFCAFLPLKEAPKPLRVPYRPAAPSTTLTPHSKRHWSCTHLHRNPRRHTTWPATSPRWPWSSTPVPGSCHFPVPSPAPDSTAASCHRARWSKPSPAGSAHSGSENAHWRWSFQPGGVHRRRGSWQTYSPAAPCSITASQSFHVSFLPRRSISKKVSTKQLISLKIS